MILQIAAVALFEVFLIWFIAPMPISSVRKAGRRLTWGYSAATLLAIGGTLIILAGVLLTDEARIATSGAGTGLVVAGCAVWAYGVYCGPLPADQTQSSV